MSYKKRRNRNLPPTAVQFARFQREDLSLGPLMGNTVVKRADPKQWLSPRLFDLLCNPLAVVAEQRRDLMVDSGWWGETHDVRESIMSPAVLADPVTGQPKIFAAVHGRHFSEWDFQAYPATHHEVVLNTSPLDDGPSEEVAALLYKEPTVSWSQRPVDTMQQMTIRTDQNREWHQPEGPLEESIARSYAFYMVLLANRPAGPSLNL